MADDRGNVSLVVCVCALVLCLSALAVADFGSMLVARARAQAAADAAALAAVAAQAPAIDDGRDDPEAQARAYAERNGAELIRCECAEGQADAVVEVAVEPKLSFLTGWAGRRARAEARAELDPDVLSYRA